MKKFLLTVLFVFIVIIIYLASQLISVPRTKTVTVYIKKGSSLRQTADALSSSGAVKNKYFFIYFAYHSGKYNRFYPGKYVFKINTPYMDAIDTLSAGPKKVIYKLTFPEGFTVRQIRKRVNDKLGINDEDFDAAYQKYKQLYPPFGEGYLFPNTYFFNGNVKAETVIDRLYSQFKVEIAKVQGSSAINSQTEKIVTIASLIQTEAKRTEEQKLISAVIYNRLRKGMRLEIDATIQYVLPNRKRNLKKSDLFINSPYNTYRIKGLPPGPICNPGLDALEAAKNPAKAGYLYYVLTDPKTGKHYFTNDYKKFLKVKKKYTGRR